ncbi:glutamyl-tRNA amidotransferase A subunit [Cavenderia fasciculata]|uniref:Glutamyl-tRNA(Gln) amidotransferase subunit A, mitochondrial n=1 Tax=Cavenderia fasciculata TaxID=261658 RepID=F4PRK7_CACFS|nr:glutamyl-tRNA amidotransferase A subunit [Cavenderia fasciculata]EGG21347.1 glutamyl-tRNA amidotransferase A subunit [Cavenderia fasciculata]|eukprot:XP_004359197.1 glutamyl-tRNA amidotransferase A subunit [Cavenderia fasciculata]
MYRSIKQIRVDLLGGKLTTRELIDGCVKRIEGFKKSTNAFVSVQSSSELDRLVEESDRRIKGGDARPLEGVPIAVKDNYSTDGLRTTAGSKMLSNYTPSFDATVVARLKHAGAIIIGKTNMDEFSMGSSSTNSIHGSVVNPWSIGKTDQYVAGGSSGGSAAAVAAGMCAAAIGSDTGGSVRQPASYCGVVGYKPSYGTVSRYGLISYASSLDTPGVLANSLDDAAAVADIIMGRDELDSTSLSTYPPARYVTSNTKNFLQKSVASNKIGRPLVFGIPTDFIVKEMDDEIFQLWRNVAREIEESGVGCVVPISLTHNRFALPSYYILATSEASSNLARYDGVRYGFNVKGQDQGEDGENNQSNSLDIKTLRELYRENRSIGFSDEVKRRILLGTMALSRGSRDNYYKKAQQIRRLISDDYSHAFNVQNVDVVLTPTAPSPAFKLDSKMDPIEMYLNDVMTIPANLAGLPSISIPLQVSPTKQLPLSLQLTGQRLNDHTLLQAASLVLNHLPSNYSQNYSTEFENQPFYKS